MLPFPALVGLEVAQQAQQKGIMQTVLVLLTDGRGNVPLKEGGEIEGELVKISRYLAESNLQIIVVDTQRDYLSRGEARRLVEWGRGRVCLLAKCWWGRDCGGGWSCNP